MRQVFFLSLFFSSSLVLSFFRSLAFLLLEGHQVLVNFVMKLWRLLDKDKDDDSLASEETSRHEGSIRHDNQVISLLWHYRYSGAITTWAWPTLVLFPVRRVRVHPGSAA
jgi:hypothetical protein